MSTLRCLIVDDEALARSRLNRMLTEADMPCQVVASAADATQAMAALAHHEIDVVFLDIQMPGMNGLALAQHMAALAAPPLVVFVSAHAEHALQAFELHAVDYLKKPVTTARLHRCLQQLKQRLLPRQAPPQTPASLSNTDPYVLVQDSRRSTRLDLRDVLLLRAELKYVSAFTTDTEHVLNQSLAEIEQQHPQLFVRTHRNTLVRSNALKSLERLGSEEAEAWVVHVTGYAEAVPVSRRQLPLVRASLRALHSGD
jgi:two-component system, LytTR family, response regulator AlgR